MITHYHNTTADADNQTLCYINELGDWDYKTFPLIKNPVGAQIAVKVVIAAGLICCEPLDQYATRLVGELSKQYKLNAEEFAKKMGA